MNDGESLDRMIVEQVVPKIEECLRKITDIINSVPDDGRKVVLLHSAITYLLDKTDVTLYDRMAILSSEMFEQFIKRRYTVATIVYSMGARR